MAWVRTATSLISFGFTIYKFFQYLREEGELAHPHHLLGPREFALLMIFIGLVALVLATFQHRNDIKRLRTYDPEAPYSLALVLAILVIALGFFGLFAVFFRQ
jgi:putative membrane protein